MLPERKKLPHNIPAWIPGGAIYFITICAEPRGTNILAKPDIGKWLLDTMTFRESRGEWYLHLAVIMPDHIHFLMSFPPDTSIVQSIGQWKRYVAREKSITWQRDFFEHRLRDDENLEEKAYYIRMNPVDKGLTAKQEDWPYVLSKASGR